MCFFYETQMTKVRNYNLKLSAAYLTSLRGMIPFILKNSWIIQTDRFSWWMQYPFHAHTRAHTHTN